MSKLELTVSARVHDEIERLVDRGEFLNREQAIEELLTMGVSVYDTEESAEETDEQIFTQTTDDQQDPARLDDEPDDEFTM